MKQVVQSISGGPVRVVDAPAPTIGATEVLVETRVSTISPGTEAAVTRLAQSSLLSKAKARPDLVRQVIKKAKTEGVRQTLQTVRAKLDDDIPLGYSACGIALEVGEAVMGIRPGQLVATGGAGKANHAEFQAVPGLLCCPVPDGVAEADASFTTIASIALHGLRLAEVAVGAKVAVIGLGLIGQLSARMARAAGCDVFGLDINDIAVERANKTGFRAMKDVGADTTAAIREWSRGRGVDAVLVTAGGKSSDAIMRTPELCRDRAHIIVVGDVGLNLARTPFYEKELSVRFARSYGPGRYDRSYEDWGVDYPAGQVRWTEGRNFETVLDLLAAGTLKVDDLITHRFPISAADDAYRLMSEANEPFLAIQLDYSEGKDRTAPIQIAPKKVSANPSVGLIGAGSFARSVLLPAFKEAGFERFVSIASASGTSAAHLGHVLGFEKAVSGAEAILSDPHVDTVIIATPHDSHAELVVAALETGKHVFCEKPLALTIEELDAVEQAASKSEGVLFVGYNRRWSEAVRIVKNHFSGATGPLMITYRINAGQLPDSHWYHDRRQGGRLLGEVCHFVDTCAALVDNVVTAARAVATNTTERLLAEDLSLTLQFSNGSIASIIYASSGHFRMSKERVELLGSNRSAVIDDFSSVILDGKERQLRPQDKGHAAEAREFLRRVQEGDATLAEELLQSTRAALTAASSLISTTTDD